MLILMMIMMVLTTLDNDPLDANVCSDKDSDGCDDCSSGSYNPSNDGDDMDSDGLCDLVMMIEMVMV